MGRLALAVKENTRHPGSVCTIAAIQKRLTPEDLADLDSLLRDETYPATVIAQQLSIIAKTEIAPGTLNRHRHTVQGKAGGCNCPV